MARGLGLGSKRAGEARAAQGPHFDVVFNVEPMNSPRRALCGADRKRLVQLLRGGYGYMAPLKFTSRSKLRVAWLCRGPFIRVVGLLSVGMTR